jgi:hypothetical protein
VAGPEQSPDLSLQPIFLTRLRLLMAIVPALRDLPSASANELQSLLERAEKLIVESTERLLSSNSASAPEL